MGKTSKVGMVEKPNAPHLDANSTIELCHLIKTPSNLCEDGVGGKSEQSLCQSQTGCGAQWQGICIGFANAAVEMIATICLQHGQDCRQTIGPVDHSKMMLNWIYARAIFYPTLWWNMLLGRVLKVRNWWDQVDEDVFLGAYPFAGDVSKLAKLGVGAIVNTCEEYPGPTTEYSNCHITQLRIPTIDFTHPTIADVEKAVAFMNEQIASGKKVYVHCKAGRARSATIVICWLIQSRQITAAEGQTILNEHRPHVNQHLTSRPVVQEFERRHLKTSNVINIAK